MEFEVSFNDATGLIIFSSILALTLATSSNAIPINNTPSTIPAANSSAFSPFATTNNLYFIGETGHFVIVFFGGAAVGLAVGQQHTDCIG